MQKFMLIDGSSVFYRAFYALPSLTAPTGEFTGAVVGFSNVLLKLIRDINPDFAVVALDVGKYTFRNEIFADYKANRQKTPDELMSQLTMLDEFIAALGIKAVGVEGYEADDIIGTLATSAKDYEVIIVTGDRDALQLINSNVKVMLLKNFNAVLYDESKFITEYGFNPEQLVDFKGLRGDDSDNIPGISGIGPKTATQLIVQFGSVENALDNADNIDKKKVRDILKSSRDIALMSKKLALINRNVPDIDFNINNYKISPDLNRVDEFCDHYAMNTAKKRIHELFDTLENLFSDVDDTPLPPYDIVNTERGALIYNLKTVYHAGVEINATDIYDVELMNYLLNPGSKLNIRPLEEVGNRLLDELISANLVELYKTIEFPLVKVLANMEERGIFINIKHLHDKSVEINERIVALENQIYGLAGEHFNINSPKQLGEILFVKLGLPPVKKTKTGFSTDAEVLLELRNEHQLVAKILDYRQLAKLKSTYIDGIRDLIGNDGRIHTTFNQTVATTGRLSSSEPNLQNIPIRTEEGREIRALFEPGDGFDALLSADYSQIELRLLAHMSADENLIDAFNKNQDVHARTAAEVFNINIDDVTPDLRRKAKAVNFGIVYGISDYGLSRDLHISRKEAGEYIDLYFERYPNVKRFLDDTIAKARETGYVTTMFGRKRMLPAIKSKNFNQRTLAERMAMNTPIQGSAADIIKLAMIAAENGLKSANLKSQMILQVHDELVIELVNDELEAVTRIIRNAMENVTKLSIPLIVDIGVGKNWALVK